MQNEESVTEIRNQLIEKTKEVERLKSGYDDFISLASHDLLSPVRKITTLLERFEQKCKGAIPEDANIYLERINNSLGIMTNLVNNITSLSSIKPEPENITGVDVNEILAKIFSGYKSETDSGKLSVQTEPIATLSANQKDIELLFKELVVNALKFRSEEGTIEIRISYKRLNEEEKLINNLNSEKIYGQISFQDNGIGFKQEMAERILKPFQRLHGNSAYPGNGIGLALCKKIAEVNGGLFRASGKENEGAIFSVILPEIQN